MYDYLVGECNKKQEYMYKNNFLTMWQPLFLGGGECVLSLVKSQRQQINTLRVLAYSREFLRSGVFGGTLNV